MKSLSKLHILIYLTDQTLQSDNFVLFCSVLLRWSADNGRHNRMSECESEMMCLNIQIMPSIIPIFLVGIGAHNFVFDFIGGGDNKVGDIGLKRRSHIEYVLKSFIPILNQISHNFIELYVVLEKI